MTSPTGARARDATESVGPRPARAAAAFTLIELILVMALLVVAVGLTYPALQGFFRGRVLDNEANRLLALTRYGRQRAVSEGAPMLLWIDERNGVYGLETLPGYVDEDPRAVEYRVDDDLGIEVSRDTVFRGERTGLLPRFDEPRSTLSRHSAIRELAGLPSIQLLPDGFVGEQSPEYVKILEGDKDALWLVQTTNRLGYELRSEEPIPTFIAPRR